jgi:sensor domain CHASE-containing protein
MSTSPDHEPRPALPLVIGAGVLLILVLVCVLFLRNDLSVTVRALLGW